MVDAEELLCRVEDALSYGTKGPGILELLERLAQQAEEGSEGWLLAHRELAKHWVHRQAWRAAIHARKAVALCPEDHSCWGLLGLAQSLLGHHAAAVRAYREALAIAPTDPGYAHNLGHLLDVAFDESLAATRWLRMAWQRLPRNREVAASYAHALARAGDIARAREVVLPLVREEALPSHHELYRWILQLNEARIAAATPKLPRRRVRRRRLSGQRD